MQIIGHRGARNEAPENTLLGFQHLRQLGIQRVELDLHLSKDQQLMVIHDDRLDRTTDKSGSIANYDLATLMQTNAAAQFTKNRGVDYGFTPVPSLAQTLEAWPNLESIQLEVKATSPQRLQIIAQKLVTYIEKYQLLNKAWVTSSDICFLGIMRQYHRHIHCGFVCEPWRRYPIGSCINIGCNLLVINWRVCSKQLIKRAHQQGLSVSVWTVNKPAIALQLKAWGADSLITDEPTRMLQYLQ